MTYPESLRALRSRNFRLFFFGMLAALAGVWMQQVAMGWLMYRLSGSVFMLGLMAFAWQIPILFLAPLGGVLSDRVDRRRLLMATQLVGFLLTAVLIWLTASGRITPAQLLALAVLLGIVNAIDTPTRHAIPRLLVDDASDLPNAIALGGMLYHFARMAGPGIGGLVLAYGGEAACFAINALAYLFMLAMLVPMRVARMGKAVGRAAGGVMEGLRYLLGSPAMLASVLIVAAVSLAASPYITVLPYFVKNVYGGDARMLGLLAGATGLGAIATGIHLLKKMDPLRLPRLIWRAQFALGVLLAVFALSPSPWLAGLALLAMGAAMFIVGTGSNSVIQGRVHEDMRGRVMAFFSVGLVGVAPLGNLAAGSMGELIGTELWVAICGGLTVLVSLVYRRALPRFDS